MTRCRHRSPRSRYRGPCGRCRRRVEFREKVRAALARVRDRSTWLRRDRALRRRYGLGVAQYLAMLGAQGWRCFVCRRRASVLYVDHNHRTAAVRGALCYRCNRGVGFFRDDPGCARRLLEYLTRSVDWRRASVRAIPDVALRRWARGGRA